MLDKREAKTQYIECFNEKTLDPMISGLIDPTRKAGGVLFRAKCSLRKRWHGLLPRSYVREFTRAGVRFRGSMSDYLIHRLVRYGYFEREQVCFLFGVAQKRRATVFIDIGANIGYYSLLAGKSGLFAEIHAIEPHPQNYRRVLWHIATNKMQNAITPHNVASSNSDCEMYISETTVSDLSIAQVFADKKESTLAVRAVKLDSLFDFCDQNIVIKMDVEGHELAALQGATRLFAQNKVFLQVEIWPTNSSVMPWLINNGFQCIGYHYMDFWFINDKILVNGE